MGFCATCGTPRNGNARFCGSCGSEFADASTAPDDRATQASGWTAPADVTRTDIAPRETLIDPPGASSGQPAPPDPFAAWYSPAQPAAAPEPPRGGSDAYWQQPTETVRPAVPGGGGYAAPAPGAYPAPPPGGYPPAPAYGPPYQPGPAGPPGGGGRGRSGLLIVLAIVVVLAAGGGAYALATRLGKHSVAGHATPPASTSAASSPPGATRPAGGGSSSPSASATHPSHSPSSAPGLVSVGPGVSGPAVPEVVQLLNKRFDGINRHSYPEYASTLTTREQANQPQSKFDTGYASTTDSGITLTALSQTSGGLAATVAFTSRQKPSDSIDGSACNTWTSTYYLVPGGSGYLIDSPPAGSPGPAHGDC